MQTPQFVKHQKISLRKHPTLSEKWLQDIIAADPSILGLGDLELIDSERIQERAGRLDLLLSDGDATRYEVELMLGACDASHLVRCIEYWDNERRKYPGYDHIAVLVAEDITSRFLNVISLMAGNIPMIAIQMSAIQIGDQLAIDFITVLNQTQLRQDDQSEPAVSQEIDRSFWDNRVGKEIMGCVDGLLVAFQASNPGEYRLRYVKSHVGIASPGERRNAVRVWPKKSFVSFALAVNNPEEWVSTLEAIGLPVTRRRGSRVGCTITPQQFAQHKQTVQELFACRVGAEEDG
jgi:hypothetical protein